MPTQPQTPKVGPREMQILRLLWQHGAASVRELHDHLPSLAYTTILSICVRLTEKGLLERQRAAKEDPSRSANAYVYTPRFSAAELRARAPLASYTPPTFDGTDRRNVEQLLAYLGTLRDEAGQRASDAALDCIAALLERAEAAELGGSAIVPESGERKRSPGRPKKAPIHEFRGRICRVCGRQAPPPPAHRQDDLRVCRDDGCRKEARRRDNLAKQHRHNQKQQAAQRDLVSTAE